MLYRHNAPMVNNGHMEHIKQVLFWGTVLGLIAVIAMYIVLLQAETEIRLQGTNTTTEQPIPPRHLP
jgi:hypothetical protein